MKKYILVSTFNVNMLPDVDVDWNISFRRVKNPAALLLKNSLVANYIGHRETDSVVRRYLESSGIHGIPEGKRETIKWTPSSGIRLLIAQYSGSQLPEGATTLPPEVQFRFWDVGA